MLATDKCFSKLYGTFVSGSRKMICVNPVVRGFYPDPSVCAANGKFYLVNSTFEYFPGLPIFESGDLVHWNQIGHCLTRQSQLDVRGVEASGGIYAPTIRYNNGRFYVVVTNVSNDFGNFYVWTDDIHSGKWSDPIKVQRGGIDPSLLFDGDKTYFVSNGTDDFGEEGISLCEIDIATGKTLSPAKCISKGCGGRYLEGPHVYHINEYYYLMVAEGGTEYGHMECMLRSKNIWGPYEMCPFNPILTNRNLGGYHIQGAGHADLVEGPDGQWFMVHLAFRQIGQYLTFHNLGRETFLEPVFWTDDGWIKVGDDGTCRAQWKLENGKCTTLSEPAYPEYHWTLNKNRAVYLRLPIYENYKIDSDTKTVEIKGHGDFLGTCGQASFVGMRQEEHVGKMEATVFVDSMEENQEAGITAYLTEKDFYASYIRKSNGKIFAGTKLVIGGHCVPGKEFLVDGKTVELKIQSDRDNYFLTASAEGKVSESTGQTKFLSSEVACGFTGTILALYANAAPDGKTSWTKFVWS